VRCKQQRLNPGPNLIASLIKTKPRLAAGLSYLAERGGLTAPDFARLARRARLRLVVSLRSARTHFLPASRSSGFSILLA